MLILTDWTVKPDICRTFLNIKKNEMQIDMHIDWNSP